MTELSGRERIIKSMLLREMGIKGDFDERLEAPVDSQALASKVDQARWIVVVLGILVVAFFGFFLYSFGFESPFLMPFLAVFFLALYAGEAKKELEKRKLIQSLLQKYEDEVE